MSVTTERTYWKLGDGDPYNGGRFGFDTRQVVGEGDDRQVIATATSRPAGAVDVSALEHAQLEAAFRSTWEARAIGGAAFVDDAIAAARALRESAAAKLAAGQQLTANEAEAITST